MVSSLHLNWSYSGWRLFCQGKKLITILATNLFECLYKYLDESRQHGLETPRTTFITTSLENAPSNKATHTSTFHICFTCHKNILTTLKVMPYNKILKVLQQESRMFKFVVLDLERKSHKTIPTITIKSPWRVGFVVIRKSLVTRLL